MTISYSGNIVRQMFRWKGSIWRSIWKDLVIFLILYYFMRIIYNFMLDDDQRAFFETISVSFHSYTKQMPLTFLLGFYVSLIVRRWWEQFSNIAWPDECLSWLNAAFYGPQMAGRRHTAARYLVLTAVLAWRDISTKVRKRFPLIDTVVESGLMTADERDLYESTTAESMRWQLPLHWLQRMVERRSLEKEPTALPASLYTNTLAEMNRYRMRFRSLHCYDWICVPLVYTQVVTIATYGYFALCLIGRQYLNPGPDSKLRLETGYDMDLYVPFFTILQFVFFVGWFKVGQDLIRPFGTDDDDFELNYIIDRHIAICFANVRQVNDQVPHAVDCGWPTDRFWDIPKDELVTVAHTVQSAKIKEHPPKLHATVEIDKPGDAKLAQEGSTQRMLNKQTKEDEKDKKQSQPGASSTSGEVRSTVAKAK